MLFCGQSTDFIKRWPACLHQAWDDMNLSCHNQSQTNCDSRIYPNNNQDMLKLLGMSLKHTGITQPHIFTFETNSFCCRTDGTHIFFFFF